MIGQEKAKKLGEACLNEMYKASNPPITWGEYNKKYGGTKIQGFMKHEISSKDYDRIKAKYAKKLDKFWTRQLDWLLLNYAPKLRNKDALERLGMKK